MSKAAPRPRRRPPRSTRPAQGLRSRERRTTCPYCRDPLRDRGTTCGACLTSYHAACAVELGRCGTLGCDHALVPWADRPVRSLPRPRPTDEGPGVGGVALVYAASVLTVLGLAFLSEHRGLRHLFGAEMLGAFGLGGVLLCAFAALRFRPAGRPSVPLELDRSLPWL